MTYKSNRRHLGGMLALLMSWVFITCIVLYLVIVRPIWNLRFYPRWGERIRQSGSPARIQYYLRAMFKLLIPAVLAALSLWPFHITLAQAGFKWPEWADLATLSITAPWTTFLYVWATTAIFLVEIGFWLWPFVLRRKRSVEQGAVDEDQDRDIFAPRTLCERGLWIGTAIVNAIAGQFLLVGFLMSYLVLLPVSWGGLWILVVIGVIYGLGIIDVKWKAALVSAGIGFITAGMFVLTHSLLPSILFLFISTGYLSIHSPLALRRLVQKSIRRRIFGVNIALALLISCGVNHWIHQQRVNASFLLKYPATYWSSLNQSQQMQLIRESLKENHYRGSMTPWQVNNDINKWMRNFRGMPMVAEGIMSAQTIDSLIQTSITTKGVLFPPSS